MFTQQELRQFLEVGVVAARLAGQHAMEQMSYARASLKKESELVTQVDKECQDIIIRQIKERYPDHGFIGEEGSEGHIHKMPPRGDEGVWWIIDPIDGTNNFAYGLPLFGVSIALMSEGEPQVGIIFWPATDSMFTAYQGGESQLNDRRIRVNDAGISDISNFGLDSHFGDELPGWTEDIMIRARFRNLGSAALQLAYVASGGLVGTVFGSTKLWDVAAGSIICELAGAKVTDWQGNALWPLDLEKYDGGPMRFLAANPKVHKEVVALIGEKP